MEERNYDSQYYSLIIVLALRKDLKRVKETCTKQFEQIVHENNRMYTLKKKKIIVIRVQTRTTSSVSPKRLTFLLFCITTLSQTFRANHHNVSDVYCAF